MQRRSALAAMVVGISATADPDSTVGEMPIKSLVKLA